MNYNTFKQQRMKRILKLLHKIKRINFGNVMLKLFLYFLNEHRK